MESKFKTKIGQLVSWRMSGDRSKKHIGIITKIFENASVEVQFLKNDWIIIIQPENLELINDVEETR